MANKGLSVYASSTACKQDIDVILLRQSDGPSLHSKYGTVIWQFLLTGGRSWLTILEMAVDESSGPIFLIHLGAINVGFIMSLSFVIGIDMSLDFLSGNHTNGHYSNEIVSFGIIIMRSWWNARCPHWADQFGIDLCIYLETNRWGGVMTPLPFGLRTSWFSQIDEEHDVLDCQCRHEFQIVTHGKVKPTFLQRGYISLCVQTGDWADTEWS